MKCLSTRLSFTALLLITFNDAALAKISSARAHELVEKFKIVLIQNIPSINQSNLLVSVKTDAKNSARDAFSGEADQLGQAKTIDLFLSKFGLAIGSAAALSTLFCHEAGHHFGGAPFNTNPTSLGLSVDGQADYWTATSCIPMILQENILEHDEITEIKGAQELCSKNFLEPIAIKNCKTVIAFGSAFFVVQLEIRRKYGLPHFDETESFLNLTDAIKAYNRWFRPFYPIPIHPNPTNPNPAPTKGIDPYHPADDCRFRTFIAGALSEARPNCWYNP